MKLLAYDDHGTAVMAVVHHDKLAPVCPVAQFYDDVDAALSAAGEAAATVSLTDVRQVPLVPPTARVLCAGLNYASHAQEASLDLPDVPDVFARWATTLTVTGAAVPLPPHDDQFDFEGELAAVVAKPLCDVTEEEAATALLGYTCFNDLSARTFQLATPRWALGKNADSSGPIGPWIVTADDVSAPDRLRIRTRVNGELMQDGSTQNLIFNAAKIAAYASGCLTLRPGDVIVTGTPEGVGVARKPPVFLKAGDNVEVDIDGIGVLRNRITAPVRPAAA